MSLIIITVTSLSESWDDHRSKPVSRRKRYARVWQSSMKRWKELKFAPREHRLANRAGKFQVEVQVVGEETPEATEDTEKSQRRKAKKKLANVVFWKRKTRRPAFFCAKERKRKKQVRKIRELFYLFLFSFHPL
ncbi:MAG: hypothetical protein D6679_12015 [Candidatus Hydrogenedentota bacterium]|nr:MAG: hypothetical protein D6679_12015 [Candidatus Hydrogenedentota bacterium]